MVMDRPLSPQSVGREFVRQYYTLLNEAPAHLHRFYNNSSSFVHGGLGPTNREMPVVVGQKQIHQQIQQLNFRDCHAKISQVDSQATLDNGVVVQVSGELSNAGQPMRRFTQTFVLAAQSPKKYYVHNDIFRYQDLLSDEELENEIRSEAEEDQEHEIQQNDMHVHDNQSGYYGGVNQVVNGISETKSHEEVPPPEQPSYNNIEMIQQPPPPAPIHVESVPVEPVVPVTQVPYTTHMVDVQSQPPDPTTPDYHMPSQPQVPPQIVSSEPKTYANLVKQGPNAVGNVYYNSSPTVVPASQHAPEPTSPPPQIRSENKGFDSRPVQSNGPKPQRDVQPRSNYNSLPRQQTIEDSNGNNFGDDRRRSQYTDSHQVFVGNIPHNASESELKELFGQFGAIVDFKILSKPSNKGPGMKLPNYGFIIFEDVSSVQAVLNAKPIMFPDENGVKLNVEEKKARRGGEGGGGRGRGSSMMGRGGATTRGGPRGGGVQRFNNSNMQSRR